MNNIKNMRELQLVKQKLQYQEQLMEKEIIGTSTEIIEHFSEKLKDFAFELSMRLILQLFRKKQKD